MQSLAHLKLSVFLDLNRLINYLINIGHFLMFLNDKESIQINSFQIFMICNLLLIFFEITLK